MPPHARARDTTLNQRVGSSSPPRLTTLIFFSFSLATGFDRALWGLAREVAGVVGVARALVLRELRIGAERPSHLHALGGIVVNIFGGDDVAGRGALFHPFLESIENSVELAFGGRAAKLAEGIRAGPREAV